MKNEKNAIIFGASGQDGFYLQKYLFSLGYNLICVSRKNVISQKSEKLNVILDNERIEERLLEVTKSQRKSNGEYHRNT